MSGWFVLQGATALVVSAGLMSFGYLLVDSVVRERKLDPSSKWALAFPAVIAFAFVLMVLHIATRGHILSNSWLVRGVSAALLTALIVRKTMGREPRLPVSRSDVIAATMVVIVSLAVWGFPILRLMPLSSPHLDSGWHMGWASQLMNGESTPTALITGTVPNYYPWMFHALVAFVAAFTPGGHTFHTLPALQLMQVAGAALGLFSLGRMLGESWRAGVVTTLFGGTAAGIALALIPRFDLLIHTPRLGGPRNTFNASYNNLIPPLPRDVGYTLLIAMLVLVAGGLVHRSVGLLAGGGFLLGLVGLTSPEFFFVGLITAIVLTALSPGMPRARIAATLIGVPLAVYSVWLVPILVNYGKYGGFADTLGPEGHILSAASILMSWGIVTPLALYGALRWLPAHRVDARGRVVLALLGSSAVLVLASSAFPRLLGSGFNILGRASRYWPILYLAVALLAGIGAGHAWERVAHWRPIAGVGLATVLVAASLPLPFAVSIQTARRPGRSSWVASAMLGQRNFLSNIAASDRADCVVAAPGSLPLVIFSYTGYRQVAYRGLERHFGNFARIRWREIYRHIPPDSQRLSDVRILTSVGPSSPAWRGLVTKYGVDLVVVPRKSAAEFRHEPAGQAVRALSDHDPFLVVPVGTTC